MVLIDFRHLFPPTSIEGTRPLLNSIYYSVGIKDTGRL